MPHPATTAELLLVQVVDLLTEIRDLLSPPPATANITEPAAPAVQATEKATPAPRAKRSTPAAGSRRRGTI